jgi:hypothetical protein
MFSLCGPCTNSRPGEELTYDYRFAGEEKLRCNCGAATCRGWVNKPGACSPRRPDGSLWVPLRQLERVAALGPDGRKRLQL